jgi:hypothetical protein
MGYSLLRFFIAAAAFVGLRVAYGLANPTYVL